MRWVLSSTKGLLQHSNTNSKSSKGHRLKKKEPFNTKIGQVCKVCGFGSNPKALSSPLTKFDLKIHMYSHDAEKQGRSHYV